MLNVKPSIGVSSCAGKLIVEEAGGRVTNLRGEPRVETDTLLVSNGLLHDKIVRAINGEGIGGGPSLAIVDPPCYTHYP